MEDPREKGQLFRIDPTTHLKGCSEKTTDNLQEHGILNVRQFKSQKYASMYAILGITFDKLSSFRGEAQNCLDFDAPEPVD